MPIGGGKYDCVASAVMEVTEATGVIVMVFGGHAGSGFSVQTTDRKLAGAVPRLPREMADSIEKDLTPPC
jgi:hypothetical protein